MTMQLHWNWSLDGWIVLAGALCASAAALLGNFLVLRRLSLLGDAISHAILPGLAGAFLLTGSRNSFVMFLGAAAVGVLTAILTEWVRGHGNVDEGAAMGVVFTTLFAIGLIMIVQAADHVDLDPSCVLHGAIEQTPLDRVGVAGLRIPRVVLVLSVMLLTNLAFVGLCFKELKLSSFDPALATSLGISAGLVHYLLVTLVAITSVASFEAVGNILVVAMFVAPPAAASMCTDRLSTMVILSVVIAVAAAVTGHVAAILVPAWFGFHSTNTAGMMAVMSGVLFVATAILAPCHGVMPRWYRQRQLAARILREDILALLYRQEEKSGMKHVDSRVLGRALGSKLTPATRWLLRHDRLSQTPEGYRLTDRGRTEARALVRSHRLWEGYLLMEAGVAPDRIHEKAEALEHFTGRDLRERLVEQSADVHTDPHGSQIPPEPTE